MIAYANFEYSLVVHKVVYGTPELYILSIFEIYNARGCVSLRDLFEIFMVISRQY